MALSMTTEPVERICGLHLCPWAVILSILLLSCLGMGIENQNHRELVLYCSIHQNHLPPRLSLFLLSALASCVTFRLDVAAILFMCDTTLANKRV